MQEVWAFINSSAPLALLAYAFTNERRMTRMETLIERMTNGKA